MANDHTEGVTKRNAKNIPGVGLPAGTDYPNLEQVIAEPCKEVFWRKEVVNAFETAHNGYSFYRLNEIAVFAKDLSGYFYRLNNSTKCFEFLFEGFKDSTDFTRVVLPPQAPTFVGFNYLHQPVFPMDDNGRPILPKDDRGKTIFPYYENLPLFPVDDSGAVCVPLGDNGKPVFPRIPDEYGAYVPCDINGRVVLPLEENGEPIYPRDEQGNILMPFIVQEDGTRRRAIYVSDEGTPVFPFVNGEQALIMHDNEVLFQHEYQQKMMMMAQYEHSVASGTAQVYVDEQFYQQHAAQYMYDPVAYQQHMAQTAPAPKAEAPNLLQKQLLFLRKKVEKKDDEETETKPAPKVIPVDRPMKPNKEKQKAERYIPEPSRRPYFNKSYRREEPRRDSRDWKSSQSSQDTRKERRDSREGGRKSRDTVRERSRRSRSRSLTWSPIPKR